MRRMRLCCIAGRRPKASQSSTQGSYVTHTDFNSVVNHKEEIMNVVKKAGWVSLAALCAGLAFAPAAIAADEAWAPVFTWPSKYRRPSQRRSPVTLRIKQKAKPPLLKAIARPRLMYSMGVAHYQKALQLLSKS